MSYTTSHDWVYDGDTGDLVYPNIFGNGQSKHEQPPPPSRIEAASDSSLGGCTTITNLEGGVILSRSKFEVLDVESEPRSRHGSEEFSSCYNGHFFRGDIVYSGGAEGTSSAGLTSDHGAMSYANARFPGTDKCPENAMDVKDIIDDKDGHSSTPGDQVSTLSSLTHGDSLLLSRLFNAGTGAFSFAFDPFRDFMKPNTSAVERNIPKETVLTSTNKLDTFPMDTVFTSHDNVAAVVWNVVTSVFRTTNHPPFQRNNSVDSDIEPNHPEPVSQSTQPPSHPSSTSDSGDNKILMTSRSVSQLFTNELRERYSTAVMRSYQKHYHSQQGLFRWSASLDECEKRKRRRFSLVMLGVAIIVAVIVTMTTLFATGGHKSRINTNENTSNGLPHSESGDGSLPLACCIDEFNPDLDGQFALASTQSDVTSPTSAPITPSNPTDSVEEGLFSAESMTTDSPTVSTVHPAFEPTAVGVQINEPVDHSNSFHPTNAFSPVSVPVSTPIVPIFTPVSSQKPSNHSARGPRTERPTQKPRTPRPHSFVPDHVREEISTLAPTHYPQSDAPEQSPTKTPTSTSSSPATLLPSEIVIPSWNPSNNESSTATPTAETSIIVTAAPSIIETAAPSIIETAAPSIIEIAVPSIIVTATPSIIETAAPSIIEIAVPSIIVSAAPSMIETSTPSMIETATPSDIETATPSIIESLAPSIIEIAVPSDIETATPSIIETLAPSIIEISVPSIIQTAAPSLIQAAAPSLIQTDAPSLIQTASPSLIQPAAPSQSPNTPPTNIPTTSSTPEPTPVPLHSTDQPYYSPEPTISNQTPSPTLHLTEESTSCSQRPFYFSDFECTNISTNENSYNSLTECCDINFGSFNDCLFFDVCNIYVKEATPPNESEKSTEPPAEMSTEPPQEMSTEPPQEMSTKPPERL